ncbi:MAG: CHASE2 domain-containing protein [Gammaproteobacteria bacterium]|nr:CHASE2 domain-containing protein [Gammaproteobacteria bacterium]
MASKATSSADLNSYLIAAIFAVITFIISYANWFLPLEQLLYDRLLRVQIEQPNQDVVIVAMDEKSLQRFGPLPWPRQLHAQLIKQLSETKAVGYDVLFDKQQGAADKQLVAAVKHNGKVIFPVVIEKVSQTGELIELMPYAELTQVATKLGLVHFELSEDNISRSTYLKSGLGEPYWRSFAAEVLDVANGEEDYQLPIGASKKEPSYDLTKIEQEGLIYIPFKQNPLHFERISFVDLIDNKPQALAAIKDKVVFVGVTATAARNADFLPVPVDRNGQIMPGVEINATLYEALNDGNYIQELPNWLNALLLALVSLVFFAFLPRSLPKRSFYYGILYLLGLVAMAWLLLHHWNSWFKVATMLVVLIGGYLIWIWRKMVANMSFFKSTVERLSIEMKHSMNLNHPADLKTKLKFLSHIDLLDRNKLENFEFDSASSSESLIHQLQQLEKANSTKKEKKLFRKLVNVQASNTPNQAQSHGVIETRIKSLEAAIQQMNFLRRFIEQTMDRMSDAIILADTDGQIFYSNLVAQRYLPELTKQDFNHLIQLLELLKLRDNQPWSQHIRKVLQDGITSELTATIRNNLDVKTSISLLDNVAGRDFLIINIVDISAIKREQRRQLEMIDFISHDLRSPMTSILALLSRYKRDPGADSVEAIHQEVEKLTRSSLSLAEQFLMLSRAESNIELAVYPVELLNAIDNALAIVMPQAANAKIDLDFDFLAYEDIWLNANQDLLERVITNLLSNAIKYSPENTQVRVNIESNEKSVLVKVKDQGEGISKEQMEAIFKPFTRMQKHEMAKVKGIGLGLRFVRAAMLRFGGKVAVESNSGNGSTFILEFPNHLLVEDE